MKWVSSYFWNLFFKDSSTTNTTSITSSTSTTSNSTSTTTTSSSGTSNVTSSTGTTSYGNSSRGTSSLGVTSIGTSSSGTRKDCYGLPRLLGLRWLLRRKRGTIIGNTWSRQSRHVTSVEHD